MKNGYKNAGEIVAPSPSAVNPGDPVVFGNVLSVAFGKYESGEEGVFKTGNQWRLPKVQADDMSTVGGRVFFDISTAKLSNGTPATGDIENCAFVVVPADDTEDFVVVELTPGVGTVTA